MDERYSKNGQSYALLDFEHINERGLKKLTDAFTRFGCPVAGVDAENRARRKDGLPIKTFKIHFEDQQQIEVSVGQKGDIIQTKINNKIIPIAQTEKLADYAKDVATKMKAGASAFAQSLAKKTQATVNQATRSPAAKPLLAQAREAQNYLAEITANNDMLRSKVSELETSNATLTGELQRQRARLAAERETTKQLTTELAALEEHV
ncbi:hypothetical protein [Edwardsiella tarda]|uniref:defense against restriction DarA-related protein n=1 Tax=Edwardsiella tarda TaxID=636 RepID=UPI0006806DD3|nr:hypothetical protein [Edwardsiella tarda]